MDFLEDFPRVFQKYLEQNEMFSNSAAGQLIRLFTPIFITNDFNNIAYTFKQVSGKKGSKGAPCDLLHRLSELKRRVAQRHLPLIKFDGHLGNCAGPGQSCCTALLMWVSGACGIIILTGRLLRAAVERGLQLRQQAQLPRCKRCQFVVNQMLEAEGSKLLGEGLPAGGWGCQQAGTRLLNLCCMRLNSRCQALPAQPPPPAACTVINLCPKCCKIYVFNLAASWLRRVCVSRAFNSFARLFFVAAVRSQAAPIKSD